MDDWHPLFSGSSDSARSLADLLSSRGLDVFLRDEVSHSSHWGIQVAGTVVLVPPEQRVQAEEIAADWRAGHPERVRHVAARLRRVVLLSLLPSAGWWIASLAAPVLVPSPRAEWLAALWVASLIVIAQVEYRRHQSERIDLPAA